MTHDPLRVRIPAALALAPMTVDVMARCLSVARGSVRRNVELLRESGVVESYGNDRRRKNGPPFRLYRLAA